MRPSKLRGQEASAPIPYQDERTTGAEQIPKEQQRQQRKAAPMNPGEYPCQIGWARLWSSKTVPHANSRQEQQCKLRDSSRSRHHASKIEELLAAAFLLKPNCRSSLPELRWRDQTDGKKDGRNEIHKGSRHPHDRPGKHLVSEWAHAVNVNCRVARINHASREHEVCRKCSVDEVGKQKIRNGRPSGPTRFAWPRLNDGPPEKNSAPEETGMLKRVPVRGPKREFIQGRNVPENRAESKQNPGDWGCNQQVSDSFENRPSKKRAHPLFHHNSRQTSQERNHRLPE
jgi:hypothetical protein